MITEELQEQQAELLFYVNDHLNTPQQLVDRAGVVWWSAEYTPFGEARVSADSTVTQNLRFAGQYYDEETELHYNWNRYYDPERGRYTTSDPIGLAGGLNTYAYVSNNPINRIDPLGLFECPGGVWSVKSFPSVSVFFGGGITLDDIVYTCESNGKTCEATGLCFGGGLIASAGFGGVIKGRVDSVTNSNSLNGFSSGVLVVGGPLSTTITGNSGTVGIGKSIGAGIAFVSCTNFHLKCDENGCE